MPTFDAMLQSLHSPKGTVLTDSDEAIIIDSKRQLIIPNGYNILIAYEGDVNSQQVRFKCPKKHENHELSKCSNKKIRWKNSNGLVEGTNTLTGSDIANDDDHFLLTWNVPAEAFSVSGNLIFSISLYDTTTSGGKEYTAFSWNTAPCSALLVGENFNSIGSDPSSLPSKEEILFVNAENRSITAPAGYNYFIANYGDKGTADVYFQISRFVKGMDLAATGAGAPTIQIISTIGNFTATDTISTKQLVYADGTEGNGLVSFTWTIPESITNNAQGLSGNFSFALIVSNSTKTWTTKPFTGLYLGKTLDSGTPISSTGKTYTIDGSSLTSTSTTQTLSGLVKLRQYKAGETSINLGKNELVVCYDSSNNYTGIKVGTADNQAVTAARYVDSTGVPTELYLKSSTSGSTQTFKIIIDDAGVITAQRV